MTPLDDWSACRSSHNKHSYIRSGIFFCILLYSVRTWFFVSIVLHFPFLSLLTTHNIVNAAGGIQTRDSSNWAAAVSRLKQNGHQVQLDCLVQLHLISFRVFEPRNSFPCNWGRVNVTLLRSSRFFHAPTLVSPFIHSFTHTHYLNKTDWFTIKCPIKCSKKIVQRCCTYPNYISNIQQ